MTKKHFIELADIIRRTHPINIGRVRELGPKSYDSFLIQWEVDRDALADFCAAQNPRFDRQRWLGYIAGECGPSGGKVRG